MPLADLKHHWEISKRLFAHYVGNSKSTAKTMGLINAVEYPTETTIRCTVTIFQADLVSEKLSRIALVNTNGNLAAIKNMFPKQKDNDIEFEFNLIINFRRYKLWQMKYIS